MSGAIFGFTNLADLSTTTISAFNSQTYFAALPLANLQDRRVSKKARTSGTFANNFSLGVDLGAVKALKIIALVGMNFAQLNASATNGVVLTVRLSNVSIGGTDIGNTTLSYADFSPIGQPPFVALAVNDGIGFSARYISINASWSTDAGVTFYEAGRLWVGDAIVLPAGVEEAWSQSIEDPTTIQRSRGGQVYADIRQRFRSLKVEVDLLTRAQTFSTSAAPQLSFEEMFFNVGVGSEVIVIPRSGSYFNNNDNQFNARTGIYGCFSAKPTILNKPGDNYKASMEIAESL